MQFSDISLTEKQKKLLAKIDQCFSEIQKRRPLSSAELNAIKKWFDVAYTYHSNAIEGNTLTLEETRLILEDGITVGGKQLREIFEAKNHQKTLNFIYDDLKKNTALSEQRIRFFHSQLLENIAEDSLGEYREIQVYITGSEEKLPLADDVPKLMRDLFRWHAKTKHDPVIKGILLHYYFVKIHPFLDGNGRIARFLLNQELLKAQMFPVIIPIIRRAEYIASLKNSEDFVDFMLDIVYVNADDYLRMIC